MVIAIVLINTAMYITSNLVIYFFKYDFGGNDWRTAYTTFNIFGGVIQVLAMMVMFPLLRKFFSALKTFYIGLGMAFAGYASLLILSFTNMSNVFLLFIPAFFIFGANGILSVLTTVFLANSVDYGEWKNNRRDESVIFSMQTFVVKLASGVAALIASVCLGIFHMDDSDGAALAAQSSVIGLRMTMTVLPIIGLVIALFYFRKKFLLTQEKVDELTRELKER